MFQISVAKNNDMRNHCLEDIENNTIPPEDKPLDSTSRSSSRERILFLVLHPKVLDVQKNARPAAQNSHRTSNVRFSQSTPHVIDERLGAGD